MQAMNFEFQLGTVLFRHFKSFCSEKKTLFADKSLHFYCVCSVLDHCS